MDAFAADGGGRMAMAIDVRGDRWGWRLPLAVAAAARHDGCAP